MSEVKLPLSDSKLSDGAYLFMLGEKYLKAQVEVLNQEAIVYPPRYYQVTAQLEELEPLLRKVKESKVNAFSYHASPDYPVMKDKPKKALILVIGFIIGVILSTLIILFASVIQTVERYNEEKSNIYWCWWLCKSVLDSLDDSQYEFCGFIDNFKPEGATHLGYPIFAKTIDEFKERNNYSFSLVLAIIATVWKNT
ncbi:Polysaccharide antigen chain regulator [Rodentibacter pneumotropicus]|uniref:Polysaccharide antigen chain regulator n=1 Tax=Rodentibacter pneumotropicus TaxID=758 RepID=A0A3S4UNG5_9PAST|nr:Polysaccharide antigen chain regulator [Rodentibacter pneumotropicus]